MANPLQSPNTVQFTVANVSRSLLFYCGKLGFKVIESFPDKKKPIWANLLYHGQTLMLGQLASLDEAKKWGMGKAEIELLKQDARAFARGGPGVGVLCYLRAPDVDAYCRRIKRKRVKLITPLKSQFYGIRDFQVVDPDGYRLAFYTPLTAAPAADTPAAE